MELLWLDNCFIVASAVNDPMNGLRIRRRQHTNADRIAWLIASLFVAGAGWAGLASEPTWLWSNPSPHGNNIIDLVYRDGFYIQVADSGQVYLSYDLDLWVPQATFTDKALRSAAYLNSRLIVTGEAGTVLYADHVTNLLAQFQRVDLQTSDWLEGVAASTNLAVAVGDNGAIYSSADGAVWQRQNPPFNDWLRSVAFGNGTFVVVGEDGLVATSTNGVLWRSQSPPVSLHLNKVVWIEDRFWAVGDMGTTLFSTTSGRTWTRVTTGATNDLYAVAGMGTDRLVAGRDELRLGEKNNALLNNLKWSTQIDPAVSSLAPRWTYLAAASDGDAFLVAGRTGMFLAGFRTNQSSPMQWYAPNESIRTWLWDMVKVPGLYVAVGQLGTVMTSTEGALWNLEWPPTNVLESVFLGIGGDADGLLAAGNQGTLIHSSAASVPVLSTNQTPGGIVIQTNFVSGLGVLWSNVFPKPTIHDLQGVTRWNNRWIVTGGNGTILTSSNATHWETQTSPSTAFLSSVASFPGGLVATGEAGTILASPDGRNWQSRNSGTTNWLYRIRYLEGQLVAVGENGTIRASTDGITWIPRPSPTESWLNDIAYARGLYWAIGTQGTLLSSADLHAWTNHPAITGKSLYALAADPHQLVMAGIEGVLLRVQFNPACILDYSHAFPTNRFAISGLPGRLFTLDRSASLNQWQTGSSLSWLDNSGLLFHQETNAPGVSAEFYRPTLPP
jgi:photosystem II stability/assembly factor-like uncharacterized protein